MISGDTRELSAQLQATLQTFWSESLEIEQGRDSVIFTMPLSYPDGWQVALELSHKLPESCLLSDRGKTLSALAGAGQNLETEGFKRHFERLCLEHQIENSGGVLQRWLKLPLAPTEIQVFGEGIVAIARLDILKEHRILEENVAEQTVSQIFHDAGLQPRRNFKLNVTPDRAVAVDYFTQLRRPVAVKLIQNKTDLPGTMEKWGYRWRELKKSYETLAPMMLYDRNTRIIDPYSAHIGANDCELFCGYDETDRVHELLRRSR